MGGHTLLRLSACGISGHTLLMLSACGISGHIMMSQCIDMCVQEACEGRIFNFTVGKQGILTCISVLKELRNKGSA